MHFAANCDLHSLICKSANRLLLRRKTFAQMLFFVYAFLFLTFKKPYAKWDQINGWTPEQMREEE